MRFREFILREDIGLGNMGSSMDKMFNNPTFDRQSAAYLSTNFSGDDRVPRSDFAGHSLHLPSDISIPNIEKTGRIKILEIGKNPIHLELSDGTRAFFTYDEFRRIEGKPEIGKVMTIIFQRHPEDRTAQSSKIEKAIVKDG